MPGDLKITYLSLLIFDLSFSSWKLRFTQIRVLEDNTLHIK